MDQESIRLKQEAKKIEAGFGYRFGRQLKGEFAALSKDMKDFETKVASKVGSAKLAKMMLLSAKIIFVVAIAVINLPLAAIAGFLIALLFVLVKLVDSGAPDLAMEILEARADVSDNEDFLSRYAAISQDLYWLDEE